MAVEVGDHGSLVAFGWDLDHAGDRGGVLGVAQRRVAVERVDRGEPCVAGLGAVAAVLFEVVEERSDQRRVEVGEVQLAWLLAGLLLGVGQQQPEGVAVGGDRAWAGVLLGHQPVGEPGLEGRREQRHDRPPSALSSRLATSAISSGDAWRYQ